MLCSVCRIYNPVQVRMTGSDLQTSIADTASLNGEFNAEIVTEYPFNALGILERVRAN